MRGLEHVQKENQGGNGITEQQLEKMAYVRAANHGGYTQLLRISNACHSI